RPRSRCLCSDLNYPVVFERRSIHAEDNRALSPASAAHFEGRLRQSIGRVERRSPESTWTECLREFLNCFGPYRLSPVISNAPATEIERRSRLRSNLANA